jgi:hypothetical protein
MNPSADALGEPRTFNVRLYHVIDEELGLRVNLHVLLADPLNLCPSFSVRKRHDERKG